MNLYRIKRWTAALAAVVILFTACAGAEEESRRQTNSEILESVVSSKEETTGSLAENLRFLLELMQNEDVRSLLELQDVKDILSDVVPEILTWLYENRPVTMDILRELGVPESERLIIGKLWDSADRIMGPAAPWKETAGGKLLLEEMQTLREDPEFRESRKLFRRMVSSLDVLPLLDTLKKPGSAGADGEPQQIPLPPFPGGKPLNASSFTGGLIIDILDRLKESDWAQSSLPKLLENENFWVVLAHLTNLPELDEALREEIVTLTQDPEVMSFLSSTLQGIFDLVRSLPDGTSPETDSAEKHPDSEEGTP